MNGRPWWVLALQFAGIGWYLAAAIVVPTLGGVWLDDKAGTAPVFILLGLALGLSSAFYGTYRMTVGYFSNNQDTEEGNGPES
jgi:F0F1-type ATP synthase assembly protein I